MPTESENLQAAADAIELAASQIEELLTEFSGQKDNLESLVGNVSLPIDPEDGNFLQWSEAENKYVAREVLAGITRLETVTVLPETQETGTLYLVLE